jgi:CheY-like chemotaxis protein
VTVLTIPRVVPVSIKGSDTLQNNYTRNTKYKIPESELVRILVAEDEQEILTQYRLALEDRDHQVVTTTNGQECLNVYMAELQKHAQPFDAVVLDYRMPTMDGMSVAKQILATNPRQRIIFASAYVNETIVESVRQLKQIVELLQKPFELDTLVDVLEDKVIYEKLEELNVKIKDIKDLNPTHQQVRELLDGLKKLHE